MTSSLTVDSNILIYAFDLTDQVKHRVSVAIMAAMTAHKAVLPMQCLCEFYSVTTRKKFLTPVAAETVARELMTTLDVLPADIPDLTQAMDLQRHHGMQFFDALLIATAARAGCKVFLSEDMQRGRSVAGLEIVNPFVLSAEEFNELLA